MNEATVRGEVYTLLRKLGYWPTRGRDATSCPRCHAQILPPIGRPDLIVLHPAGRNRVVEVKVVNLGRRKSFAFSEVTPEQRRWLDAWAEGGGLGYLAIGTVDEKPRRLWIIDWLEWCRIEGEVLSLHKSIPLGGKKTINMSTLCSPWELIRITGGWELPEGHSLACYGVSDG